MKKKVSVALILTIAASCAGFSVLSESKTRSAPQVFEARSLLPSISKTELIGKSELILYGTVKKSLQTDLVLRIEEVFKGVPYDEKEIKIRIAKSGADDSQWISEEKVNLNAGDEAILFLSKVTKKASHPSEDYYYIVGMNQGKFLLTEKTDNDKEFSNHSDSIQLSTFKDEIPKELEKFKNRP